VGEIDKFSCVIYTRARARAYVCAKVT